MQEQGANYYVRLDSLKKCEQMSIIFPENEFVRCYQKLNFYNGVRGNRLGGNVRNDRGIIPCFHLNTDFDMCFARKTHVFPEQPTLQFLFINNLFL